MTRKTKKGITGKNLDRRGDKSVGPGLSFKDEDLTSSQEIEQAIRNKKKH